MNSCLPKSTGTSSEARLRFKFDFRLLLLSFSNRELELSLELGVLGVDDAELLCKQRIAMSTQTKKTFDKSIENKYKNKTSSMTKQNINN